MSETMTLSQAARDAIEMSRVALRNRRAVDADLPNLVEMRDWLLCAATNLESPLPTSQPGMADNLRRVADYLAESSAFNAEQTARLVALQSRCAESAR
jgi:hypothetical protein